MGSARRDEGLTDSLDAEGNGDGVARPEPSPSAEVRCALADLPENVHQYIHALERRISNVEIEQKRFMDALIKAGAVLFENPAMKMFSAAFPKDVKAKLQEVFKGVIP